jgi:hypothetical protein
MSLISPQSGSSTNLPLVTPITSGDFGLSDQGVFYNAVSPTPGTGIIGPVSTTWDETKAILTVFNGGLVNISPKFLRLHCTVIGTTGTGVRFTQTTDSGNRYSSGGTALVVSNSNQNSTNRSAAQINFGALTTTAATAQRRLQSNKLFKSDGIEVVNETYQFSWGSPSQLEDPASLINNTTTLAHTSYAFGPLTIGPGQSFVIHQWRAAITVGITFEVEFGFIEK